LSESSVIDPLAEVVSLLQPSARLSKHVTASDPWAVRREGAGHPFYCVVLEGQCQITIDGYDALPLEQGDFVLIPAAKGFCSSSRNASAERVRGDISSPVSTAIGGVRVGDPDDPVTARLLVGYCVFGSPDAALLVSLLPNWVHVRGENRLSTLVQLVADETRSERPARDVVLSHLLEVLLIEALRAQAAAAPTPGLARGLADPRLATALRHVHERPQHAWTVAEMAKEAAMSRSAFFDRFSRAVGVAPMEYLLAWRMALAKQLLRRKDLPIVSVAEEVGYSSASTFGVAFTRHVGMPPARFAREARETATA
jgi:AraC-like DNA-binding protein